MPWVTFSDNFEYYPTKRMCINYKKGTTRLVPTAAAEAAKQAGKLVDGDRRSGSVAEEASANSRNAKRRNRKST